MPVGPSLLVPGFTGKISRTRQDLHRVSGSSGPVRMAPRAVASPQTPHDVALLLEASHAEGWTITPRGAGTGMPGGNVGPGLVMDMTGFQWVDPPDPDARSLRAGVGATMDQVVEVARTAGLDLPPLPSSSHTCTVGGVLANNGAGARSFRHGSIRAWTMEVDAVLASGARVRGNDEDVPELRELHRRLAQTRDRWEPGWPDVRKNSSGYELPAFLASRRPSDLLVGSEGTLGIITSARLRLRPAPPRRAVTLVGLPSVEALSRVSDVAREVRASACEFFGDRFVQLSGLARNPDTVELVDGQWGLALVEAEGEDEEVRRAVDHLEQAWRSERFRALTGFTTEEAQALWDLRHEASPMIARSIDRRLTSTQIIEDVVVPPAALPQYLSSLGAILAAHRMDAVIFGHAGDGNVHVNLLVDFSEPGWAVVVRRVLDQVTESVAALGGTLSGEHGDGRIRAPYLDRIWSAGAVEAFRLVKSSLDPHGILNPGVILPLPGQDALSGVGEGRG